MDGEHHKQTPLTNEQRKVLSSKRISMQVSPYEAEVIKELRKFNFGRFIIQVLDGVPVRYITEVTNFFFEGADAFDILEKVKDREEKTNGQTA